MAAWYSLVFILSSLAVFGLSYSLLSTALKQKDRGIIESGLKLYASRYQSGGLPALAEEVKAGREEPLFVRLAGPRNQTVFQDMPAAWDDFDLVQLETTAPKPGAAWTYLAGKKDEGELFADPDLLEIESVALPDGSLLQVGKSTEARDDILEYFQAIFAIVMVAVLGLGFAGGALLANRSLRPVRDLTAVLRSIRQTGNMSARALTRQTGDELDELAELFNSLLDTIASLVNRMRSALDNIAHDLRTPMTRLRGTAELALRSPTDVETYQHALADCLEEAEQSLTTLNTLMDVAEAETGAMKLDWEKVELPALLRSVVGLYEHVAEDKEITIRTECPERLRLRGDPKRLRQALANLLDNAIKYTPRGGRIEMEAHPEKEQVAISVNDTGHGIQPEELPKIWDRLYRGAASQSERGLGLGLSLVRAVVLAHKGSVEARSAPGQGSRFVVRLPMNAPP